MRSRFIQKEVGEGEPRKVLTQSGQVANFGRDAAFNCVRRQAQEIYETASINEQSSHEIHRPARTENARQDKHLPSELESKPISGGIVKVRPLESMSNLSISPSCVQPTCCQKHSSLPPSHPPFWIQLKPFVL